MTDQPSLRDRIRRAICEASGFTWLPDELMEPDEYGEHADAVMAVLPAPVDRAAVLREAADALHASGEPTCSEADGDCCWFDAVAELRRMAAEQEAADAYDRAISTPPSAATSEAIRNRLTSSTVPRRVRRMAAEAEQAERPGHEFVPDAPRAPGLCVTCGDSRAWHRRPAMGEPQQPEEAQR